MWRYAARSRRLTSTGGWRGAESDVSTAIASAGIPLKYGIKILFEEIQDVDENHTKFIVLGTTVTPQTVQYNTSIIVDLHKDRPGALHELLGEFSSRYQPNRD